MGGVVEGNCRGRVVKGVWAGGGLARVTVVDGGRDTAVKREGE